MEKESFKCPILKREHKVYSILNLCVSERKPLQEIKKAILIFHYAEKIKSNLIIATSMLEVLETINNAKISGGERLMEAYFNALIREVNIAINASKAQNFSKVRDKLEEALEQTKQHNYSNAIKLVSDAISLTTTNGSQAAEILKDKDLI